MSKKSTLAMAIVVGLLAICAPVSFSVYLAWQQGYDAAMAHVAAIAESVLRRTDATTDQVFAIYDEFAATMASPPCSEENLQLMQKLDLGSEYVQAVGYIENDTLLCSSHGRHAIRVGPPNYTTAYGTEGRTGVEFPVLRGRRFLLVNHKATGYAVAVHPDLPLDIFVEEADMSIGIFSFPAQAPLFQRGRFEPRWMERLGDAQQIRFSDGENLVVIQRSRRDYAYAAYAALPAARLHQELLRTASVLVPIGIGAGLILALAVLFLARQQLALPAVLKVALKRDEFYLEYQPIVDLRTGRWVGAEALIRWRRPTGETIRPDLFIAVAEETGLIRRVTQHVIAMLGNEAHSLFRRCPDFHIAINLSAADLESRAIVESLRQLADTTAAGAGNLMVEATERGFMKADLAKEVLREIRSIGIQVAIDDFGTGYSSLAYLETFELDYLKIDKSFVDKIGTETATSQGVLHVIAMAKDLGLQMIAEGVETEAQARYLRERGVQFAQGWLFAKPMPFAQLIEGLSSESSMPPNDGLQGNAPQAARP